jgi:RNA polymerase sigma factor (sigma-70 family)
MQMADPVAYRSLGKIQASPRSSIKLPDRVIVFEALYRAEVSGVMAFFARRSRDPQTVFDLTADTFVEVIKSLDSAPPDHGSERAWVFSIARRTYAQHCERSARRLDAARREHGRQLLAEDETEQIVERIDAERAGRELLTRLAGMSRIDRETVELVDLAGLSPGEAASVLNLAPGVMRVRLFRARARLKKGSNTNG